MPSHPWLSCVPISHFLSWAFWQILYLYHFFSVPPVYYVLQAPVFHSTAHPFRCLHLLSSWLLLIPGNLVFDCRALEGFKDVGVLLCRLQATPPILTTL